MIINKHPDMYGEPSVLKHIGYWRTNEHPELCRYFQKGILLPWPGDFVNHYWRGPEKTIVLNYLKTTTDVEHWRGNSWCRFKCVKYLHGSTDKSDGIYIWPEAFAHYVENHNVVPPKEFIQHVLAIANYDLSAFSVIP